MTRRPQPAPGIDARLHRGGRSWLVPTAACSLALLWLTAQALDAPWLAAAAVVAGLGAPAALATRRRTEARHRTMLTATLLGTALLLAIAVGLQLVLHDTTLSTRLHLDRHGVLPLLVDLGLVLTLAPLMPLAYAVTFLPAGEECGSPSGDEHGSPAEGGGGSAPGGEDDPAAPRSAGNPPPVGR